MKKEIMDWDVCKKEYIREVSIDKNKINSILKMCSIRLIFAKKQEINNETASIITEIYYEIIKELLTALLLKNGLKSDNHECLISYFKKNYQKCEYETNIIYELKGIRNKINYNGFFIEKQYLIKNKLEFEHIIGLLVRLIKES
ncbi:hypothetical protein COY26_02290 [Candidatus Woesearchaeota archaeon CG_4_10_14_0_2_um_filter_33_10]|nr:MAG: hypothetical protein COV14_02105 [Candidatus Woesearchaeota archaeon CG10_big_fil_rev_8_21_14_0_10_33_12]PIZ53311.1 MAG: hypothetical protein COY26_02290 [Candidatus Woesearchaeota archaeon CG_4_10_14_0_2_um_filter_33_10]